jgi:hypothetical protein
MPKQRRLGQTLFPFRAAPIAGLNMTSKSAYGLMIDATSLVLTRLMQIPYSSPAHPTVQRALMIDTKAKMDVIAYNPE